MCGRKMDFLNAIVNIEVAAMDKRSIFEGIVWYTLATRLLHDYLKEDACVWVATKKALLEVWLGWIAVLLNLGGANDEKLRMQRSEGRIVLFGRHCAP